MPGYGVAPPDGGIGLLPWSWAVQRLAASRDYWLATRWPDGRPHVMPVWAVWQAEALWFSSGNGSRKTRNLRADPRCAMTTDNARQPVVVEGTAELVTDESELRTVLDLENAKYSTGYGMELFDPAVNSCFRLRPDRAFGIAEDEFTTSPTRWTFAG